MRWKPPRGLRTVAAVVTGIAALTAAACLTPQRTRSVSAQVTQVRRQAEEATRQQRGNNRDLVALAARIEAEVEAETETRAAAAAARRPEASRPAAAPPAAGMPPRPPAGPEALPVLAPIETPAAAGPAAAGATSSPQSPGASAVSREAVDSAALYRDGYALYHRREYAAAERRLRELVDADPQGPLADNARYWIGETLFARGLFRQAIGEFRVVLDRHGAGNKAAHALYKIALCHERLGEEAPMRRRLRAIIEEFPASDVAPLARARLERP